MALESIALIPSGYKANKLYCQLPVDGGADLTTSRASGATRVNKNGLIEDVATGIPRLDYTNGGCPSLLLEPASTNLITYSEDFTDASWLKGNTTITSNSIISPDGTLTADTLTENATNSTHSVAKFAIIPSVGTWNLSFFVKPNGRTRVAIGGASGATDLSVFDLSSKSFIQNIGGAGSTLSNQEVDEYPNGWLRVSVTIVAIGSISVGLYLIESGVTTSYLGDGTSGIYVWGAQLEQQSYATSYIRTNGTTETRIADAVTGNSSLGQVINSSEGVLYAEMSALANDGTQNLLGLNGGSISNSILFGFSSSNGIRFYGAESGTGTGFDLTTAATITSNLKVALRWSLNDVKFYINGTQVGTDTSFATSSSLNELSFDNGSGSSPFYGRIRDLRVYDTALTDAELTALTTL